MDVHEHDRVVLAQDLSEHGLMQGDVGTVVQRSESGGLEVEFMTLDGETVAVVSLSPGHLHPIGTDQMIHARKLGQARRAQPIRLYPESAAIGLLWGASIMMFGGLLGPVFHAWYRAQAFSLPWETTLLTNASPYLYIPLAIIVPLLIMGKDTPMSSPTRAWVNLGLSVLWFVFLGLGVFCLLSPLTTITWGMGNR